MSGAHATWHPTYIFSWYNLSVYLYKLFLFSKARNIRSFDHRSHLSKHDFWRYFFTLHVVFKKCMC